MLFSLFADLKITQDGQVKILEFGPNNRAGFLGYQTVTGRDMMEDEIMPWIKQNYDVVLRYNMGIDVHFAHFINRHANLLIDAQEHNRSCVIIADFNLENFDVWFATHLLEGLNIDYMNAASFLMMAVENKAILSSIVENLSDHPSFGSEFAQLFPRQFTHIRKYNRTTLQQLMDQLKDMHEVVVKIPDGCQGRAAIVANRDEMPEIFRALCVASARKGMPQFIDTSWNHNAPLIIVQERIKGRPVKKDGKPAAENEEGYDGVMRVPMTLCRDLSGTINYKIHPGYWKLPPNPVGQGPLANQIISFSPGAGDLRQTFGRSIQLADQFAPVICSDYALVTAEMEKWMPAFIDFLQRVNCKKTLKEILDQKHDDAVALASMMFISSYYDGMDIYHTKLEDFVVNGKQTDGSHPKFLPVLPPDIIKDFNSYFADNPGAPATRFLRSLVKGNSFNNAYRLWEPLRIKPVKHSKESPPTDSAAVPAAASAEPESP